MTVVAVGAFMENPELYFNQPTNLAPFKPEQTMSSREIAKLTEKQHKHVTQAADKIISENSLVKNMMFGGKYIAEN